MRASRRERRSEKAAPLLAAGTAIAYDRPRTKVCHRSRPLRATGASQMSYGDDSGYQGGRRLPIGRLIGALVIALIGLVMYMSQHPGQSGDGREAARRHERRPGDGPGPPGRARDGQQDGRRRRSRRGPARGPRRRGRPAARPQQRRPQEPLRGELPLPPAARPEDDQRVRPARRPGLHHRGPARTAWRTRPSSPASWGTRSATSSTGTRRSRWPRASSARS